MRDKSYDIVIVGSGAGGGTVAQQLAPLCHQGLKIAVLEWGPRLREEEFTGRELEMADRLFFAGGGVLTRDQTMTLAFGRAYGGSTVVYTGTSIVMPPSAFERWDLPELDYADLIRRSDKYSQQNNVHLLDSNLLNDNNRLFREGCEQLGYEVQQFPINIRDCRGAGVCNLGCPNAAKQGTNRVQLPDAERDGVEVITNCEVKRIGNRELLATVTEEAFGEPSAWAPGEYRIAAKIVIIAGGAVNSPALLLRSKLPVQLPMLGRYFTAHPALILVAQHDEPISNFHGHPKSYYCDEFVNTKGFLLETCMYFPFTTAKNLSGFGAQHAELMSRMDRLQMILVLAIDAAMPENRVTIDRAGNPVVDYRLSDRVLDSLFDAMKISTEIFFAAGARRVHSPAGVKFLIDRSERDRLDELIVRDELKTGKTTITSAHMMGGCRMGRSSADSVTDIWGQVHGVPWLFVADSSLMPHCAEVNPYITIMALADRVAERVRDRVPQLLEAQEK